MSPRWLLAVKGFFRANFCTDPADDGIFAQQITPHMTFFAGTMFGWNFAVTALCAIEFHLLHDSRLIAVAVSCWLLAPFALYDKHQLDRAASPPTPQQQADLFTRWMLVTVVGWVVLCLIVVPYDSSAALLFYSYALGFVVAIHAASSSSYMPGFMWFVAPNLLAESVICAWYSTRSPAHMVVAISSPVLLAFMWFLGKTFNQMHRTSMRLQLENTRLVQELTLQTEEARMAHAAAEQAGVAKSRFLAAASHDLRQPIHAQGLFLDVLSRTQLDAQQRQLVDGIHAASQASADMLHSLLDFSRIEAGVVLPRVCAFRVQPVLNKIEREFAPQADAKGLSYRSRECPVVVQSDPALVELILRNLVANAIRYTLYGGVLVACRAQGSQAVFEVWDTGIGIAPEHQQDVFLEFHQLGNSERDRRNGLGLGLAIVKALARTLDHAVSVTSTVGKGSVFRVALPVAQGGMAVVTEQGSSSDLLRVELFKVRVLVIDDDEVVCQGMLQLLRDWGCECEGAQGIDEAVAIAPALQPQIIVSDYRLREQHTGVQAIEAVRAAMGVALPALLITGDTAPERIREALASGLPLFHKPISPAQLYRGLVAALPERAN